MKKKFAAAVLSLCMVLGLTACGDSAEKKTDNGNTGTAGRTEAGTVGEAGTQAPDGTQASDSKQSSDGTQAQAETDAKKDVTISIMHFWVNADETIKEIAQDFHDKTGITVEVFNSAVATHLTELNERVQSDDLPEVFTMWPGASVPPYIESNVVADLTGSSWADTLQPFAQEASTYDGKLCLAPVNTTYLTLAYNVEVFERLGMKAPESQAEFEAVLETLKNDPEVDVPFINGSDFLLNVSSVLFTTEIYQKYPDFDEKVTNGEMQFNGKEVFDLYKKLLIEWPEKGWINGETALATDRMGRAVLDFVDGKAGIMSLGSFDLEVLKEINTENTPIAMFPYPAADNHGSLLAAAGEAFALSAYAQGEEKEAAAEFLDFLMLPENNAKICKSINSLSALNDVPVDTADTLKALEAYQDQPTHGWMVWPMEVQNNLKNLGDVLTAAPGEKEAVLQKTLDGLQEAWNMK